jgi:hypothetical protein
MDIKNQIPFWSCLIISSVNSAANKFVFAGIWAAFALFILVIDYKANNDTNKPA